MFLKLSLSARPSAGMQFKAEAALLTSLREQGVAEVSRVLGREMGRLGVSSLRRASECEAQDADNGRVTNARPCLSSPTIL